MRLTGLLFLLLVTSGPAHGCGVLAAEATWIREPPPGMPMTAGYAVLRNDSPGPITIVEVSSPDFADVTLHRTVDEAGVSRMRPALPLRIEPGSIQRLEPGGYHLMLSDPRQPMTSGDAVRIEFQCATGSATFTFTLSKDAP